MAIIDTNMAVRPLSARSGRRLCWPYGHNTKGRPEQGTNSRNSRYVRVVGDTGCGSGGTDQRALMACINGPGDVLG